MKVRVVLSGRRYDAAEALPDCLTLPDGGNVNGGN